MHAYVLHKFNINDLKSNDDPMLTYNFTLFKVGFSRVDGSSLPMSPFKGVSNLSKGILLLYI